MEKKRWKVPVVYQMYGVVIVEAETAQEAYNLVLNRPQDYNLPEESYYLEDSFVPAYDDCENVEEA